VVVQQLAHIHSPSDHRNPLYHIVGCCCAGSAVCAVAVLLVQSSDHMAADIPLMHSDSLRPLVVNSMQLAIQQLRQHPQAHDCEVGPSLFLFFLCLVYPLVLIPWPFPSHVARVS
jgi:hypothetical protein